LTTRPFFNFGIKDKMKNTLLHHAAMTNNPQAARLVVEKFPYMGLEQRNVLGQTPLEIAMQNGNVEAYKYLMSKVGNSKSVYKSETCYNVAKDPNVMFYKPPPRV
jgi:ankyrin repeat protein